MEEIKENKYAFATHPTFQQFIKATQDHHRLMITNVDHNTLQKCFARVCQSFGQFIFYGPQDMPPLSLVDEYLESIQTDGAIVRLLARYVHLPKEFKLMYGGEIRKHQVWIVVSTTHKYLVQEAQRIGCDWNDLEERKKMRSRLDQSGVVVMAQGKNINDLKNV